jgi:hypothetical protein
MSCDIKGKHTVKKANRTLLKEEMGEQNNP